MGVFRKNYVELGLTPILNSVGLAGTQGTIFHVKPYTGSDGNDGRSPGRAFKTVLKAYNATTTGKNDVVLLYSEGNTSAQTTDYWSAQLDWSNNCTHLIGVCSPTMMGQRSRISQLSTATAINGLLKVTGNSCIFANILVHQGVADATSQNPLYVTGDRNYFYRVNVQGLLNETQAQAGSLGQVYLSGAEENTFDQCVFGTDTVGQGANTTLTLAADSRANFFRDCYFVTCASSASYVHVTAGNDAVLGFTMFDNCKFINSPTGAGAVTAMTNCCTNDKALTDLDGMIVFNMPFLVNITDIGSGGAYLALGLDASGQTATDIGVAETILTGGT